jgi:hypothetical protein
MRVMSFQLASEPFNEGSSKDIVPVGTTLTYLYVTCSTYRNQFFHGNGSSSFFDWNKALAVPVP